MSEWAAKPLSFYAAFADCTCSRLYLKAPPRINAGVIVSAGINRLVISTAVLVVLHREAETYRHFYPALHVQSELRSAALQVRAFLGGDAYRQGQVLITKYCEPAASDCKPVLFVDRVGFLSRRSFFTRACEAFSSQRSQPQRTGGSHATTCSVPVNWLEPSIHRMTACVRFDADV